MGCMDSTATNYNQSANTDDGTCTNCYAVADIPNDTIVGCDSVQISVNAIPGGSYSWNTSNISTPTSPAIGDYFQGGYVFHIENNTVFIAAPSDQVQNHYNSIWWPTQGYEFGCFNMNINGANGETVGTGYQNTMDIVNANCTPYALSLIHI